MERKNKTKSNQQTNTAKFSILLVLLGSSCVFSLFCSPPQIENLNSSTSFAVLLIINWRRGQYVWSIVWVFCIRSLILNRFFTALIENTYARMAAACHFSHIITKNTSVNKQNSIEFQTEQQQQREKRKTRIEGKK